MILVHQVSVEESNQLGEIKKRYDETLDLNTIQISRIASFLSVMDNR